MAGMLMRRSLQRLAPSLRAVVRIPYFLAYPVLLHRKRPPHCGMLWVHATAHMMLDAICDARVLKH